MTAARAAAAGGVVLRLSPLAGSALRGPGRAGQKAVTCRPRARWGRARQVQAAACGRRAPGLGRGVSPACTRSSGPR